MLMEMVESSGVSFSYYIAFFPVHMSAINEFSRPFIFTQEDVDNAVKVKEELLTLWTRSDEKVLSAMEMSPMKKRRRI